MRIASTATVWALLLCLAGAAAQGGEPKRILIAAEKAEAMAFPVDGIALRVSAPVPVDVKGWRFRTGVPLGVGMLKRGEPVRLVREGKEIPVQTEVLATWGPADSTVANRVKWLGLDFVDDVAAGARPEYRLLNGAPRSTAKGLVVEETDSSITVDNGRLSLVVNKPRKNGRGFKLFDSVRIDGRTLWRSGHAEGPYIVDGEGRRFLASNDTAAEVKVEQNGPLAAVIRAEGWFVNPNVKTATPAKEPKKRPAGGFCRFVTRLYVAANQPDVRVQHTFILTDDSDKATLKDIGIALPIPADAKAVYGGVKGEHAGHTFLLQKSWDAFDLKQIGADGKARTLASGKRAGGWVRAGAITVAVRDFWQNYPKEFEVVAVKAAIRNPQSGMVVHLWPSHGIPRMDTKETLTDDNAWRLPFVHSGDALDFRIPEVLKDKKTYKELHSGRYVDSMFKANAIGISKTHDLLICFDAVDAEARVAAFQANAHLMPDPKHLCATGVIGSQLPSEPDQRPLVEHRLNNGMKWLIRTKDAFGSFGMWNYGDTNTYFRWKHDKVWPNYRRLWAATHYNTMRVAWWLAMRSGDHTILQHARRQTQHVMDIDICHWTNELFESRKHQPVYHRRKAVGGICDYKGVVHWHAGDRYAYNACVDYLLYDYYLIGNRRAWDVAMEHGYYINRVANQNRSRPAAGQADTLVELYKATWDPKVGAKMKGHIERIFAVPVAQQDTRIDWTPWLQRYWDLTHDPKAKAYQLALIEGRMAVRIQSQAYAYAMTGKKEHAVACAREVFLSSLSTVVRNDEHDGTISRQVKQWVDGATAEMLSLKAAQDVQLRLADFQPKEWPYWTNWGINPPTLSRDSVKGYFKGHYPWPDEGDGHRLTAYVHHDGTPKRLWLGFISLEPNHESTVTVFDPAGRQVRKVVRKDYSRIIRGKSAKGPIAHKRTWPKGKYPEKDGKFIIGGKPYAPDGYGRVDTGHKPLRGPETVYELSGEQLPLGPDDAKGFYKVVYSGHFYIPTPILPPAGKVWIKVGKESTMTLSEFQFFHVPADVEEFELAFLPSYQRQRFYAKLRLSAGAVIDPDANPVASISCGLETEPQVIRVKVKPEHRGKTWCLAGNGYSIVRMRNVPPYISPSFDAFRTAPHVPPVK